MQVNEWLSTSINSGTPNVDGTAVNVVCNANSSMDSRSDQFQIQSTTGSLSKSISVTQQGITEITIDVVNLNCVNPSDSYMQNTPGKLHAVCVDSTFSTPTTNNSWIGVDVNVMGIESSSESEVDFQLQLTCNVSGFDLQIDDGEITALDNVGQIYDGNPLINIQECSISGSDTLYIQMSNIIAAYNKQTGPLEQVIIPIDVKTVHGSKLGRFWVKIWIQDYL